MDAIGKTKQDIIEFANENRHVEQLQFIVEDGESIEVIPVSTDGMINYIFKVVSENKQKSLILKYGEDTVRVRFGSGDGVPMKRQRVEFEALQLLHSLKPGCVPRPYCLDQQHQILAMEDLSHMHLLHGDLVQGKVNKNLAAKLGEMMGILHSATYKENVRKETWQTLKEKFSDKEIKGLIVSYRMIRAFNEEDSFNDIHPDCLATYRKCRAKIEECGVLPKIHDLYNMELCVCHVDIHGKSVFVDDSRIAVFDCEWATLSHPVIDLAYAIAWYIFSMLERKDKTNVDQKLNKENTRRAIRAMVTAYMSIYNDYMEDSEDKEKFLSIVLVFIGAYIFGHANFSNLKLLATLSPARKMEAMEYGTYLMTVYCQWPETDIDAFMKNLF